MTEYTIQLVRGHILITDDRGTTLLIDTGSPMSFHSDGVIAIGGETFNVGTSLMGTDSRYITDNVGAHVDGLVGMNILSQSRFLIDVPGGRVVFGHPTDGMTRVPSGFGLGYMSVDMEIRGRVAKVILDTGAPTSYVSPFLTEGLTSVDTVTDFNPSVPGGTFETPIFEFPASFAGQRFEMRAGHLPTLMQTMISFLGVDGVVGMELLKRQPLLFADGGVWV